MTINIHCVFQKPLIKWTKFGGVVEERDVLQLQKQISCHFSDKLFQTTKKNQKTESICRHGVRNMSSDNSGQQVVGGGGGGGGTFVFKVSFFVVRHL